MTAAAQNVLTAFVALSPAEQQEVAAAILGRAAAGGDLPAGILDELAAELFRAYDGAEAARSAR